jgi:tetratricopeptide (TPR) repeat protein
MEAERLFRQTLAREPAILEARVRLARLLGLRGRHIQAEAELRPVLQTESDGVVLYYAHLFSGRTAKALKRLDVAARHYADARRLFPDAQSALLAQSQLALLRADTTTALEVLEHLKSLPLDAADRSDPWWQYSIGPGRNAKSLLASLWTELISTLRKADTSSRGLARLQHDP